MFYPMMVNIKNKRVSIFGGGKVSYRKSKKIIEYGGLVRVVSPSLIDDFNDIKNNIEYICDKYKDDYLKDSLLVIAASNNNDINKKISRDCNNKNILCNVVDDISISDYIVPSSIKRGDLVISVSTGGKSPVLSSKIKNELEEKYDDSYGEYIKILGEIRDLVLSKCNDIDKRRIIFREIVNLNIEELKDRRVKYEKNSRI